VGIPAGEIATLQAAGLPRKSTYRLQNLSWLGRATMTSPFFLRLTCILYIPFASWVRSRNHFSKPLQEYRCRATVDLHQF